MSKKVLLFRFIAAFFGVSFAFFGGGALAMIIQALSFEVLSLISFICVQKLRLLTAFSYSEIKSSLFIGLPIGVRKLNLEAIAKGVPLILAVVTSTEIVGIFAFAMRIVEMPKSAIASGAQSYGLPFLSKSLLMKTSIISDYQFLNKCLITFVAPMFFGVALVIEPMLELFFGDKWVSAVLPIQILCVVAVLSFSRLFVPSLVTVYGMPAATLKIDIVATCLILLICFFYTKEYGVLLPVFLMLLRILIIYPVGLKKVSELIGISIIEQLRVFFPSIISTLMMTFIIISLGLNSRDSSTESLLFTILFGIGFYLFSVFVIDRKFIKALVSRRKTIHDN
jgi:O-antigen/teichoic acid export membrane protein